MIDMKLAVFAGEEIQLAVTFNNSNEEVNNFVILLGDSPMNHSDLHTLIGMVGARHQLLMNLCDKRGEIIKHLLADADEE